MTQASPPLASPDRYTLKSGARPLDGYTIKRAIGRGGFGEVYYATSDAGKEVALKLVTRNLDVERRGVVQCMNLKSPNLITIYDLRSNEAGDSFVIMEYISGPSLANVLAEHPAGLPPEQVRIWLKGLVDGVAYLHDHGIVHRDLKPANVFLEDGVVKIGDYGLAKALSNLSGPEHSECIGTCHYMAPEVSTGKYHKPIDIYALGVMLYEMLTGQPPFAGESAQEVLMKHLTAQPDVASVPESYRAIVARALSKDPNQRPADPHELLPAATGKPAEDILRIEDEPGVFYIGPNTWPTRKRAFAAPAPKPRSRKAKARMVATAPHPPSPAPQAPAPPPAPLPSGRLRTAELAMAMVLATPVVGLVTFVTHSYANVIGVPPFPLSRLPLPFAITLLATWTLLILGRYWEGREAKRGPRLLSALASGFLLGIAALVLVVMLFPSAGRTIGQDGPNFYTYGLSFGLMMAAASWGNLTGRDRSRRVRLWPVIRTTLVVLAATAIILPARTYPSPFWPATHGLYVAALATAAAQLVSPWDPAGAAYARYLRHRRRYERHLA